MIELERSLIRFQPWIGPLYGEGLWGRKVLVVGESHYNKWQDVTHELDGDMTRDCIRDIISGASGASYWTPVANRIGGPEYEAQARSEFWSRASFYNFIQSPVEGGPGARPTPKQWAVGRSALVELLEYLRPNRIIFTGLTIGKHLPPFESLEPLGGLDVGFFAESKDRIFLVAPHPRSGRLLKTHTPLFRQFIAGNFEQTPNALLPTR
jgi:hypothetical protein